MATSTAGKIPSLRDISGHLRAGKAIPPSQGIRWMMQASQSEQDHESLAGATGQLATLDDHDVSEAGRLRHEQWRKDVHHGDLPSESMECSDGLTRNGWMYVNPDGSDGGFIEADERLVDADGRAHLPVGSDVHISPVSMIIHNPSRTSWLGDNTTIAGESVVVGSHVYGGSVLNDSKVYNADVSDYVLDQCNVRVDDPPGFSRHELMELPTDGYCAHVKGRTANNTNKVPNYMRNVTAIGPVAIIESDFDGGDYCEIVGTDKVPVSGEPPWASRESTLGDVLTGRKTVIIGSGGVDVDIKDSHVTDSALRRCEVIESLVVGAGHYQSSAVEKPFMGSENIYPLSDSNIHQSNLNGVRGTNIEASNAVLSSATGENLVAKQSVLSGGTYTDGAAVLSELHDVRYDRKAGERLGTVCGVRAVGSSPAKVAAAGWGDYLIDDKTETQRYRPSDAFSAFD